VGVLDEAALATALAQRPSATLALLAAMSSATDERLRRTVQAVAARLVLDRSRVGRPRRSGIGRPRAVSAALGGDLDIDASIDTIVTASGEGRTPSLEELVARDWGRTDLALVVLLDHSGSMTGERLAAAAVTAAACALRTPGEHAVLAFAREVTVLKPLRSDVAAGRTVERVLQLRGHGVTGLAGALRAAGSELAAARATRRVVVLLSDCRATDEQDPLPAARGIAELIILAPQGDCDQAAALARDSGARYAPMDGADTVPALLEQLLA
jgi:Mg-chelatase subunit ChlD